MLNEKPRAFFAHSTHSFGTDLETRILKVLRDKYRVICPNSDIGRLVQFKNYLHIVGWADVIIVLEHEAFITMGVYAELIYALKNEIPVIVIRETPAGFVFVKVERVEYQPIRENRNQYGKLILKNNDSAI